MDFAANSFNQYQEPKIPIIIYQNYESAISKGWVKDEYATIATPSSIPPSPLLHNIPLNRQQKEETELGSSYKPFSTSMPNLTLNDDSIVAPIINKSLSLNDPVPLHNNHLNDSMSQLDLSGQSRPITPQLSNSGVSSTTTTESSLCSTPPPQFIFKKPSSSKNKRRSLFRKSKSKNSSFDFSHYNYKHMKFDKYGRWGKVLGSGIGGTVRLIHRALDDKPFAVKKFRNRFPQESEKSWLKSITAEFCIGSTLHHENIIETIDIIQERGQLHQIMEFAPYDLFEVVMSRQMTTNEINCCFKQIVLGINYLHNMGVAHLDLKLDNCVLNEFGTVKIIDFGCATVFKDPFSNKILFSSGPRGSDPYICPESYTRPSYDVRLADIWSLGIIYICMNTGRFPWLVAKVSEASYKAYLRYSDRLIKKLPLESRPIMKKFLEVVPEKRATLQDILEDEWFKNIECCVNDHRSTGHTHHLVGGGISE